MVRFQDRTDAGWQLARKLAFLKGRSDVVVLALGQGGVRVAYEIALAIRAPLDFLKVGKLIVPGNEELAIGAAVPGGARVLDTVLVQELNMTASEVQQLTDAASEEVERAQAKLRALFPALDLAGKQVILVDDGVATGLTIRAAARQVKTMGVAKILVAVPVIPSTSLTEINAEVDAVVFLATPEPFCGVANWYYDFTLVSDGEAIELLKTARELGTPPAAIVGRQDIAL